jgi:putative two-component system response regulator
MEALHRVRTERFRLVVSDWEMPRMNGPDLCRAIRADDLVGYVYFVLVTGHDSPRERVEGLSAGADDFVGKPFDPSELIARVRTGERILSLETRDVAIFAMAKLAESRDPETGTHLERVRSYCRVLAKELATVPRFQPEVDDEFVRLIYLTSPLHDIGKVGIPDSVLLKPGRLNDQEFEIMKMHAMLGAQTLDAALREFPGVKFLKMAREIAATHHERWDGSGYPEGRAGHAIPLSGRIMALADVYDALTSKRVYKDAFTHEIARSMILKDAGTHFDPDIVETFVRTEKRFVEIRARHAESLAIAA